MKKWIKAGKIKADKPIAGVDFPIPKNGKDGLDADESKIIKEILKQIPKPKNGKNAILDEAKIIKEISKKIPIPHDGKDGSPDTPEEVRDKLQTLKGEERIDASAIKNLPRGKGGGGGPRFLENLIDVDLTGLTSDKVLKYNGKRWVPGTGGHTIQNAGTNLTARTGLNFSGALTATDDSANDQTDITATRTGVYRTIWIPASAMTPRVTNGAAGETKEYATNDIMQEYFLFDGATEEGVQFTVAMPDEWNLGTIKAKFFWDASTGASAADGVTWGIAAQALSNDDAIDTAFAASVDTDDVVIAVGDLHVSPASAAVTVSGTPALGDMIQFEITRVVGDAQDDMTEDAKLLGVSIQYLEGSTEPSAW